MNIQHGMSNNEGEDNLNIQSAAAEKFQTIFKIEKYKLQINTLNKENKRTALVAFGAASGG